MLLQLRQQPLHGQIETLGSAKSCIHALRRWFTCVSWYPSCVHGASVSNSFVLQTMSWSKVERLYARRDDGDGQPLLDCTKRSLLLRDTELIPVISELNDHELHMAQDNFLRSNSSSDILSWAGEIGVQARKLLRSDVEVHFHLRLVLQPHTVIRPPDHPCIPHPRLAARSSPSFLQAVFLPACFRGSEHCCAWAIPACLALSGIPSSLSSPLKFAPDCRLMFAHGDSQFHQHETLMTPRAPRKPTCSPSWPHVSACCAISRMPLPQYLCQVQRQHNGRSVNGIVSKLRL